MRAIMKRAGREVPPSASGAVVLAGLFVVIVALSAASPSAPVARPQPQLAAATIGSALARPTTAGPVPTAAAAPLPTAAPGGGPLQGRPPLSAGTAADAGVVFVLGGDDAIYRYDGPTGALERIWARSTLARERHDGVYVVGRHGGAALLRWDGTTEDITCGTGFAVIATTGACASVGTQGLDVRVPGDDRIRSVLPRDWGIGTASWSPDGRRLLLIRVIEPRPGPGMDPGLSALWLMDVDGRLRELYRPPTRGVLSTPTWSPDGTKALVRQIETTSASFAADGVGITTLLVDVLAGTTRSLGTVMHDWSAWSSDGRLAYVRGSGRQTWWDKQLFVLAPSGPELAIASDPKRVAVAPAWGPRGELGWVSGPAMNDYNGDGYIDGRGAGQRIGVIRDHGGEHEVTCGGGRAVEGLRWSADGATLLLLCRKVGRDPFPLELWLYRLGDGTRAPLVTGLMGDTWAAGFGYYGAHPAITSIAAWSLGGARP